MFERSRWRMQIGAERGGWAVAMSFAPPDMMIESKQRVDGRSVNCIVLALGKIIGDAGDGDVVNGERATLLKRGPDDDTPFETP